MHLGISTAHQPTEVLRSLLQRGLVDFVELGTGKAEEVEEVIRAVDRSVIETIHGLPFLDESTRDFMFNPCYRPLEAAERLKRMITRASQLGLEYRSYGVHGGLLGEIVGPDDFTLKDHIDVQRGLDNLAVFRRHISEIPRVIMENIYGWDRSARAIGMTQEEIERIGEYFPLLLDLGHTAINFEIYGSLPLNELLVDVLPIKEIHLSFLNTSAPPPWDHHGFRQTAVNLRIISKLRQILDFFPEVPVVLEIDEDQNVVEDTLRIVTQSVR